MTEFDRAITIAQRRILDAESRYKQERFDETLDSLVEAKAYLEIAVDWVHRKGGQDPTS